MVDGPNSLFTPTRDWLIAFRASSALCRLTAQYFDLSTCLPKKVRRKSGFAFFEMAAKLGCRQDAGGQRAERDRGTFNRNPPLFSRKII
jgi:hypothetical protein